MANRLNVRERLQIAKGRLLEYEGRLKELEGRLRIVQARAEQATGRARLQLRRAERELRTTIATTLEILDGAIKNLEPRVRRALDQTAALRRGLRAGIKAGAARYRASRPK